jgi:hypothetical protein
MYEALCRPFGTTLDIVHTEGGPPITQRTSGLGWLRSVMGSKSSSEFFVQFMGPDPSLVS